jgi:peptidoglycan/xylan/chitin deacetylase (PgdA/CDA1 family)
MKTPLLSDEGLVILLFHGVVGPSRHAVRNYTQKHLGREFFARLMTELARTGRAMSMEQVIEHHEAGADLPPRSFAVTFDDGFENNCSVAAPILADLSIPATFYVTSGFIEHNGMSWIDRIEYCIEAAAMPGSLRLPWEDRPRRFADAAGKIAILDQLRDRVKRDASIDVDALITDIFAQCGVEEVHANDDPLDRKMSWRQVAELHAHPLFTVGGHSHTHRILSFLSPEELEREIATSLDLLRERAGIETRHYSYPEGLAHCYSPAVIDALQRRGIACCPTAERGVNRRADDLFRLKRNMVAAE